MRAGAWTLQQTLTTEAASVLKQSVSLARRRGHAQVTPLHVAATLLSSRISPFRRACLRSRPHSTSHPMQCRALELCFHVALNRLPTTTGPFLHNHPSLSNALVAALKRAQAHQRRGCIEQQQQQQPLLSIKVELEQLIISILDDPSVSRVMREAGFSSTCVKKNVEENSVSSPKFYPSSVVLPPETRGELLTPKNFWQNSLVLPIQKSQNAPHYFDSAGDTKEELRLVVEVLTGTKRRNTVIVGDCVSSTEGLMSSLMEKVERGEVPNELKSVHFIKLSLTSLTLRFMGREDVQMKMADLRRKVGSVASAGGAIIYAGDLKWAVEDCHFQSYSPAEHVITEIASLISQFGGLCNKVWLMGTANYQTYMRCQMKSPSLERQWSLQAVAVPSGGLGLSLHTSSGMDLSTALMRNPRSVAELKPSHANEEQEKLTCCAECIMSFEKERELFKLSEQKTSPVIIYRDNRDRGADSKSSKSSPSWSQPCKAENTEKDLMVELRQKWNGLCRNLHHPIRHSGIGTDQQSDNWWSCNVQPADTVNSSLNFFASSTTGNSSWLAQFGSRTEPWSLTRGPRSEPAEGKTNLTLGISLYSALTAATNQARAKVDPQDLSWVLRANISWQSSAIQSILEAFIDQKLSGKGTWLWIEGSDWIGKRRLALAVAESLFGSVEKLIRVSMKGRRVEGTRPWHILMEALCKDANCVVVVEEVDCAEPKFMKALSNAFDRGKLEDPSGNAVSLNQTVFILNSSSYRSAEEGQSNSVIQMKLIFEKGLESWRLHSKRTADFDLQNRMKYPKSGEEGERTLSRQSSFSTLDLNVSAQGCGDEYDSDLTMEAVGGNVAGKETLNCFLKSVKNRFVLDCNTAQFDQICDKFRSKIEVAAGEVWRSDLDGGFQIEGQILEELANGSANFLDSCFEKWLREVFQACWAIVPVSKKEGVVRLCLGGKQGGLQAGFLGSNLPTAIQVDM